MSSLEFDPIGSARFIPDMIKNDTLINVLDPDQLNACLKHITLNVDDSLYILNKIQSKYKVPDRFKAVQHINIDFGKDSKFNSKKYIEFIKSLCQCLHFDILDSIASITDSAFSKIDKLSAEIKQKATTTPVIQKQTNLYMPAPSPRFVVNKNIEELKKIAKTQANFDRIYTICHRIAVENDKDAMSYAIREKFVFVTENSKNQNVFTKAAFNNDEYVVKRLIQSGIDVNTMDDSHNTALSYAAGWDFEEILKYLLAVPGINVNARNLLGCTALIMAAVRGKYNAVKILLSVPGIDINARNYINESALDVASRDGYYDIVNLLRANGAY